MFLALTYLDSRQNKTICMFLGHSYVHLGMSGRLQKTVLPGFGRPLNDYPSEFESEETGIRPRLPHAIVLSLSA
jgi:hypothetical protein